MYKNLIKELLIYGAGTVLPRLIMVVFNWLFTNLFLPSEVATFSDMVLIDSIMIQVLLFGFETAIFRFATKYDNDEDILKTAYSTVAFFGLIFAIVGVIFHKEFAHMRGYPRSEYVLMGICVVVCDIFVLLAKSNFRLRSRPIMFTIINISNVAVQALAILFFLLTASGKTTYSIFTDKVGVPLLANVVSSGAMCLLVFPNTLNVFSHGKFSLGLSKAMLKYGSPVAVASLSFLINESYDKISMKTILGESITGKYSACYKIATFMALFEMAFRMGIEPFFFKQAKNKDRDKIYASVLLFYTLMGCTVYIGIMANLDWLKLLMISEKHPEYFDAMNIVPIILIANIMLGIYNNISVWYKITDRTYFGMFFSILGAFLMIFSCEVVMRHFKNESFNYMIPAWATLAVYGIMATLSYLFSRKYNPIPYSIYKIIGLVSLSLGIAYLLFTNFFGLSDNLDANYRLIINNLALIGFIAVIFTMEYPTIRKIIGK